jgi:general secretion pathway protein G
MSNPKPGRQGGFTFIELVASLSIIGLIASLCFPLWALQQQREKERELRMAMREIRTAIDAYKQAYDEKRIEQREGSYGYPRSLQELVEGVTDISRPDGRMLYFLRRIPLNPFIAATEPQEKHWLPLGFKEPKEPQRWGDEIYDITVPVAIE